jgi:hypothetical protein
VISRQSRAIVYDPVELLITAFMARHPDPVASHSYEFFLDEGVICPLLSGPKSLLFWTTKELGNGQEAQAGRDHRQAA